MVARRWDVERAGARPAKHLVYFHPAYAAAFLGGILFVCSLSEPIASVYWLLLALVAVSLLRYSSFLFTALCFFLAGGFWLSWQAIDRMEARWPEEQHGETMWVTGHIVDVPLRKADVWRFRFGSQDLSADVRVSWYRHAERLEAGQCWRLKLRMRTPRGTSNPGGFDYEGWLFQQDLMATAYVKEAERCVASSPLRGLLAQRRQVMSESLETLLGGQRSGAVIQALVLGQRSGFSDDDWQMLRRTGTSHLMAISGLHVGLVAAAVYWLGTMLWRLLRLGSWGIRVRPFAMILSVIMAAAYVLLSGLELPAQRALVMLSALYMSMFLARTISPLQTVSIAAMSVLVLDPFAAMSAGFWLSFLAVVTMVYLLAFRWQTGNPIRSLILIQLALSIVLVPVGLYWFGEAALLSVPVNLVLVPLMGFFLPVLLLVVAACLAGLTMLEPILLILAQGVDYLWSALHWLAGISESAVIRFSPVLSSVVLATLGGLWLFAPVGFPARWLAVMLWLPIVTGNQTQTPSGLRMTVLDVGQGLAVVVEVDAKVLVYDAGPAYKGGFDAGKMVVAPYLRSRGYQQIDQFVLSHGDLDHRGGYASLSHEFPILDSLGVDGSDKCTKGYEWSWGEVSFSVLHPANSGWSGNDGSCVLKINYKGRSILLSGDIEIDAEHHLVREERGTLKSDVLLAPHHGSASSSSWSFVKHVRPELVIFSSGWRNRWGFPPEKITRRYELLGVDMLNTAYSGAIVIEFGSETNDIDVREWRVEHRRLWSFPASE